jgi:hypothetical protein
MPVPYLGLCGCFRNCAHCCGLGEDRVRGKHRILKKDPLLQWHARAPTKNNARRESGFRLGNGELKAKSRVARPGDVGQHPRRAFAPVPVQGA